MSITPHLILLGFYLAVFLTLTEGEIGLALLSASNDRNLRHALLLLGLLIGGNLFGAILCAAPKFQSLTGCLFVSMYELLFLLVSMLYLSWDISVMIGIAFCDSMYFVITHCTNERRA
jgi:hypothetical protein